MLKILFFSFCLLSFSVQAEDDHGHGNEKGHEEHHKDDHEEHDEHNETASEGFKLTAKAIKNFGLTYVDVKNAETVISQKAVFRSLSEVNLYRLRSGFYKRIDFKILDKTKDHWKVSSKDLAFGDKIVVDGIGFLRIAEIAASGGLSDSHSH